MLVKNVKVHANINQKGELSCVAIGYPKVSFTWVFTYNYEQISLKSSQSKGRMFSVSRTISSYYGGKELSTSVLRIRKVDVKHWGTYKCIAENTIGYAYVKFQFRGHGKLNP